MVASRFQTTKDTWKFHGKDWPETTMNFRHGQGGTVQVEPDKVIWKSGAFLRVELLYSCFAHVFASGQLLNYAEDGGEERTLNMELPS